VWIRLDPYKYNTYLTLIHLQGTLLLNYDQEGKKAYLDSFT